jgi:Cu/Ag efflux pump CusA
LSRLILRAGANGTAPVRLGDVAQVRIEGVTRYGAVTRDGAGEAVEGIVVACAGPMPRRWSKRSSAAGRGDSQPAARRQGGAVL